MKRFFLIPLLACFSCVMAWANVAQITFSDEREAVDCADLAALQTAIAALPTDGTVATIKLLDDIDAGDHNVTGKNPQWDGVLTFKANQTVVLDLNGKTLSHKQLAEKALLVFNDQGNLTITDSNDETVGEIRNTQTGKHYYWRTVYSRNGGYLHLDRCKIVAGAGCAVCAWSNELVISEGAELYANMAYSPNGGNGKNDSPVLDVRGSAVVTINGGYFKSVGSSALYAYNDGNKIPSIIVNGGTFEGNDHMGFFAGDGRFNVDVRGGSFNSNPADYVNQTAYSIEESAGVYVVNAFETPAAYTVYTLAELKSAFGAATQTRPVIATLGADIVVNEEVELPHGSQMIVPAGKTLSVVTGGLFINEGITTNRGTIATEGAGFFSKPGQVVLDGGDWSGYQSAVVEVSTGVYEYNISNAMQLQFLALIDPSSFAAINLTTDINIPNVYFETLNSLGYPTPITFDGKNHSINNLKIKSVGESVGLFYYIYGGAVKNLTINANIETYTGYAGALTFCIYPYTSNVLIDNVTVNGTVHGSGNPYGLGGFCGQGYAMSGKEIWFANCTNNATISTTPGYNVGGFIGTSTKTTGKYGFYNCVNTANISAHNNVSAVVGYGSGSATYEFISFANNGTISRVSGSAQAGCGVADLIGAGGGTIKCDNIDPEIWTAVYDGEKYIAKRAGILDNKTDGEGADALTTDWALSTTWTDNEYDPVVPNESDVVTVNNTNGVVVSNNTDAVAKEVTVTTTLDVKDGGTLTIGEGGLTIEAGATVTVEEGATLVVGADGITIADGGHLVVEATEEGGTGVVLVDPAATANTRPEATIELVPDAYKVSEDVYKHRYVGIPLYFEGAEEFTAANWEREAIQGGESVVSHAKIWNNGWQDVASISEFVPFKGYALTNESTHGVKYTFKGKLVGNGDGQMNFVPGFNLFANSYTAPINIQTLLNGLSENVKATIYMFDNDRLRSVSKADFAGFRTPKFTVIPSLQAFFVLMDDGTSASESINYAEAVFNNSLGNRGLYAPARQETPDFNRVRINIAAENGTNDEVYLIEAADYTNDFENGFDEAKFMNNGLNIFATTAYGRQATTITNDINGTFIGVQGNGTYTLSFDELVGEEYQIRDLENDAIIAMNEANTYTFVANGANEARFVVEKIAMMPTAIDNVAGDKMFVSNNTLFVGANNADIQIFAANGQLVIAEKAQATVDLSGLAAGVYTVRVANQTLKFVK